MIKSHWMSQALTLEEKIEQVPVSSITYGAIEDSGLRRNKIEQLIKGEITHLPQEQSTRIQKEFFGFGPLEELMLDSEITEILVLAPDEIWYERHGKLTKHQDQFASDNTFSSFIDLLCERAKIQFNIDNPMANGKIENFRIHIVGAELTQKYPNITLRRHPENPWTFEKLGQSGWASCEALSMIKTMVDQRKNILIVGATGSGKTSLINSCLQAIAPTERVVILEDTSELNIPNPVSTKLLTRFDAQGLLKAVDLSEITRQALRMRPDRLVMGEVRGSEAKDLLMALSTGHEGSFASLHASTARQALIRLEMLIQLGAPNWSLWAIRNLICLSLNYLIVVQRHPTTGRRELCGIHEIRGVEETGLLLDKVL